MESKKINQLATNVNPQTSDLTTIGDPITGQLKKITWLQVANLIGAQASVTLQQVTDNGNVTNDPITTAGLTLTNLGTGVPQLTNGNFAGTYGYGLANGVATLDSGGKIPAAQLPSSVMEYKGTWNASTNTPTLADGTGDNGDVYLVNVAGTQNLGSGSITFAVGDWVVYNGTIWQKSLNSNAVSSVFGRTGTITAQEGDYNIDQLGDVAITSLATNDYLRYSGSSWVNTPFPTFVSSDKLVLQVRNNSGATINKGTVVYINGATAGYPTIAKALANDDATSAQTIGMVQDNISNNSNGVVVIVGQITGIDTSAFTAGTQLYLSGTTAGAFTSTKPYAPLHLVYVGIVTTQNAVNGVIEVKVQNGVELEELHNVDALNPNNNDGIFYNSTSELWEHKSIATVLGYTPEQPLTFSSPLVRTTNTISIPAATGSVNGYLTSTDWTTFNNKLTSPMTTLGDIIFGGTSGNANRLAGNITTTKQYLSQTGTGTESASPTWATITGSDITGAALTKSDDTNVTLTLGGTPATALLRAASLTLGWTGTLAVSRGGTGANSFGSNQIIYGNSASALQSSNQFTFSPTGVFFINNTISAGGIAMNLTSTVNAAANNDIIYGVRISPFFNNLSFTGVTQRALGVFGDVYINGTITSGAWGGSTITIAKGGTGLTALGTAGQLLRVNSGATALEYFTPTYISAAITSLNGLTDSVQTFATGTTGTDFNISSASGVHTFNIPSASATNRGLVTTGTQTFAGDKTFSGTIAGVNVTLSGDISVTDGNDIKFNGASDLNWRIYRAETAGFTKTLALSSTLNLNSHYGGTGEGFAIGAQGGSSYYEIKGSSGTTPEHFFRGYVGIGGVPNTSYALTVSGASNFSTDLTLTGTLYASTTSSAGNIINASNSFALSSGFLNHSYFLAPNMTGGGLSIAFGKAASGYNTGKLVYNHVGDGNRGNYIGLGFWGNDNLLTMNTYGGVSINSSLSDYGLAVININDSSNGLLVRASDNDTTLYLARFQSSVGATSQTWVDRFIIAKNGSTVIGDNIPATNVRLWVKGEDQTASNYALDVTDSVGSSIAWFRNDKSVRFGGSVGIGTNPGYRLHISNAANAQITRFTGGTSSNIHIGIFATNEYGFGSIGTQSNHGFNIYTNDTDRLSISNTGAATFSSSVTANGISSIGQEQAFTWQRTSGTASDVYSLNADSGSAYLYNNTTAKSLMSWFEGQGVSAEGSFSANSPAAGRTGEGIIAGRSFKIDASGSGQAAKLYVVSNTISDTYGSGLQIQFSNSADTKGFGFNLSAGGDFELYTKTASNTWQRNLQVLQNGYVQVNILLAMADNQLRWRSQSDSNHATVYDNTTNGPVQYGYQGAAMGYNQGSGNLAYTRVIWTSNTNYYNYGNTTTWNTTSDIRIKENIKPIESSLSTLLKLNPVSFDYKSEYADYMKWNDDYKLNNIGFIAQEWEKVFPDYMDVSKVKLGDKEINDLKNIDTSVLMPLVIKAIQELNAKIDAK